MQAPAVLASRSLASACLAQLAEQRRFSLRGQAVWRGLWRTQGGRTLTQPPRGARKGQQVLSPPPTLTPRHGNTLSQKFDPLSTPHYTRH